VSGDLDLTIVTGMSGAGRSSAADVLEDLGWFVIDNLPPALIPKVAELARGRERPTRYALVVDARAGEFVDDLLDALRELRESGAWTRIVFVDASDEALVRRYEASRRPHPLSPSGRVSDGIAAERAHLEALKGEADIVVDTTNLNIHELRDRLREIFDRNTTPADMQLNVISFGYKHGLPLDADIVLDCRFLPNPHWVDELRPLNGRDAPVRDYVLGQHETSAFLDEITRLLELLLPAYQREGKAYLTIGIGCTGGKHRSVAVAEELACRLGTDDRAIAVHHRDLERG
jgi:RNase adapter protein RapZ